MYQALMPIAMGAISGALGSGAGAGGGLFGSKSTGGTMPDVTTQTQTVTQDQYNQQTVNIGSSIGADPSGFGVPYGASMNSLIPGFSGLSPSSLPPPASFSLTQPVPTNWGLILAAAGALVLVYVMTQKKKTS